MKIGLIYGPIKQWPILRQALLIPTGLLAIAAYARERGFADIQVIDAHAMGYTIEELEELLRREQFDVVGVTAITRYAYEAMINAMLAKEANPSCVVVAGNMHFSYLPEESLHVCPAIDVIVHGEGEETFFELLRELGAGATPEGLRKVRGLSFMDGETYVRTPDRPLIPDLDTLPMPAYDLVPMERYQMSYLGARAATPTFSRGCAGRCHFCSENPFWGMCWRGRSAAKVADEFQLLQDEHGMEGAWVGDANFLQDRKRNEELIHEMGRRPTRFNLWIEARIAEILRDRDILPDIKKAIKGDLKILFGVEALDPDVQASYNKPIPPPKVIEAARVLDDAGIMKMPMFIVGDAKESRASMAAKMKMAKRIDAHMLGMQILTPFPGSPHYEDMKRQGKLLRFNYGNYDFDFATQPSEHMGVREIELFHKINYARFYLDVTRLPGMMAMPVRRRMFFWYAPNFALHFLRTVAGFFYTRKYVGKAGRLRQELQLRQVEYWRRDPELSVCIERTIEKVPDPGDMDNPDNIERRAIAWSSLFRG
jgi:anaerobic magnesium-protoporphyrin IX monomethyl ester cyclase